MKIQIDSVIYEGTAVEILNSLRDQIFDPTEFPDTETYLWFLQNNVIRSTGKDCALPKGDLEAQAKAMAYKIEDLKDANGNYIWSEITPSVRKDVPFPQDEDKRVRYPEKPAYIPYDASKGTHDGNCAPAFGNVDAYRVHVYSSNL